MSSTNKVHHAHSQSTWCFDLFSHTSHMSTSKQSIFYKISIYNLFAQHIKKKKKRLPIPRITVNLQLGYMRMSGVLWWPLAKYKNWGLLIQVGEILFLGHIQKMLGLLWCPMMASCVNVSISLFNSFVKIY